VRLIDSGEATAASVAELLVAEGLARTSEARRAFKEARSEPSSSSATRESEKAREQDEERERETSMGEAEAARERRLGDDLDHFYVTDAAERFARVAERFLGSVPAILEAVEVWGQDELRAH
ncbi:MAG: hypothetical protein LC672_03410, partial [Acidobacteria bacterium]|nr:hypothetical protein [Acidobacteriota bacterium]